MPTPRSPASLALVISGRRPVVASDGDLARGLVAGEGWAVTESWRRFAPMVLMTAERTLGSRAEAEDVAQEVFYRLIRKAKTLRDPDSLRSFVYSFAVRVLRGELRRRKLRRWFHVQGPDAPETRDLRAMDVEARDVLRRFNALLDRLTPRDRLVFVLRRMEAMTVDEIATVMELSVSTVKRAMAHASDRLSSWVDADPGLSAFAEGKPWGR